ncbi:IS3 family transposase [Xanthomonas theicola]|nr:IS3 family transposase [Xanthomonas theicola]
MGSGAGPRRSCARRRRPSPRRGWTAVSRHDGVGCGASRHRRSRADLPGVGDGAVEGLQPCGPGGRSRRSPGSLEAQIRRVRDQNRQVDGVRKVCKQLLREGRQVARCTVDRACRPGPRTDCPCRPARRGPRGSGRSTRASRPCPDASRCCPGMPPARPGSVLAGLVVRLADALVDPAYAVADLPEQRVVLARPARGCRRP